MNIEWECIKTYSYEEYICNILGESVTILPVFGDDFTEILYYDLCCDNVFPTLSCSGFSTVEEAKSHFNYHLKRGISEVSCIMNKD